MKSLIIGGINDVYLLEFISEIMRKRDNVEFDVLTFIPDESGKEKDFNIIFPKPASDFTLFGKHIGVIAAGFKAYSICRNYDEVIILSVEKLSFAVNLFAHKKTKIILCYYGSDLLRSSPKVLNMMRGLVKNATTIVMENEYMKERFQQVYGDKNAQKVKFAHYGTNNAKTMLDLYSNKRDCSYKVKFDINENKLSILIGYSGIREQKHIELIKCMNLLPEKIKPKVEILLHIAYGAEDKYIKEIENELSICDVESKLITEFMTGERLAEFRGCADIMINWQPTDCMAASVVESMEAGAIVINGSWLVYPDIMKFGGYYESAQDEKELLELICNIVSDSDEYKVKTKQNRGILNLLKWNYSEWSNALDSDQGIDE